jgi:hypothetical protein
MLFTFYLYLIYYLFSYYLWINIGSNMVLTCKKQSYGKTVTGNQWPFFRKSRSGGWVYMEGDSGYAGPAFGQNKTIHSQGVKPTGEIQDYEQVSQACEQLAQCNFCTFGRPDECF